MEVPIEGSKQEDAQEGELGYSTSLLIMINQPIAGVAALQLQREANAHQAS